MTKSKAVGLDEVSVGVRKVLDEQGKRGEQFDFMPGMVTTNAVLATRKQM